jgi:hypothetical protein
MRNTELQSGAIDYTLFGRSIAPFTGLGKLHEFGAEKLLS